MNLDFSIVESSVSAVQAVLFTFWGAAALISVIGFVVFLLIRIFTSR